MSRFEVAVLWMIAATAIGGCDQRVEQTLVVRANITSPSAERFWVSDFNDCSATSIAAGWYQDGLWIFRLSSTRGGVGVVTQELTLCAKDAEGRPTKVWHSLHGGGAPLLVVSCVMGEKSRCVLYQDGYPPGAWSEEVEE